MAAVYLVEMNLNRKSYLLYFIMGHFPSIILEVITKERSSLSKHNKTQSLIYCVVTQCTILGLMQPNNNQPRSGDDGGGRWHAA